MSYNGSGVFNINSAGQPVVSNTVITSTAFNLLTADLATGLTNAICKDGQSTCTTSIPFVQGLKVGGANELTIGSTGGINSQYDGENEFVFLLASGDVSTNGYFKSTGFGNTATFDNTAITTTHTPGFSVVCNTGGVILNSGATSWSAISDERYKTDMVPITGAMRSVSSLRACTGRYKTDDTSVSRAFLIAQDVQKVLPQAVKEDNDGVLHLAMTDVIPLLVAALREANLRLDQLENKMAALNR